MSEPWTNTTTTTEEETPPSEDVPTLIQNEILNLDNNNNNDEGGVTIQDTNGLSIVPISSSPLEEEEITDDLILENKSNGPCSNDNAEYSNNTQPCPNAIVPYNEIFDNLDGFVNGTEVHPEVIDDGDGKEEIGFNSSSVDELIDDERDKNNGGSTNGGGDTNNNQDNTTEEKAPWTDNTTNPGKDTNIILINNIRHSTYYSCTATEDELVSNTSSNNNNGVQELPIAFSYEIYTTPTNNDNVEQQQRSVLDKFERQLAKGVADSLGLVDCNTDTAGILIDGEGSDDNGVAVEVALRSSEGGGGRQLSSGGLRRSLLIDDVEEKQQNRLLDGGSSTSSIVGISMNPIDMVDTEIAACTSTTPEQLVVPSVCSPILGAMTAWLTVSQRRQLRHLAETSSTSEEEMLLSTIETYINTNQDTYLNDDLLHLSYIGDRSTTEQVDPNLDTSKIEINPLNNDGSMNPGMIGLAVAMAVLAVIAALVGVAYHRRRQQRQQQFSAGPDRDLEEGAFPSYGLTPESESLDNDTEAAMNEENHPQKDLFGLNGVAKSDDDIEEEDADDEEEVSPKPSTSSLAALGAATVIARELSYSPMVVAPRAEEEEEEDVVAEEVDTSSDDTEEGNGIQESTSFASAVTPVASPHQNPEHSFSDIVPTLSPMTDGVEEEDEETSKQSSEDSSFFVDVDTAANNNVTSDQSHIDAVHNLMFGGEDKENSAPTESFDDDRGIV